MRGLQRLGRLAGGSNLASNAPEIVLANAHLLDDRAYNTNVWQEGSRHSRVGKEQPSPAAARWDARRPFIRIAIHRGPFTTKVFPFPEDHFPSLEVRSSDGIVGAIRAE